LLGTLFAGAPRDVDCGVGVGLLALELGAPTGEVPGTCAVVVMAPVAAACAGCGSGAPPLMETLSQPTPTSTTSATLTMATRRRT